MKNLYKSIFIKINGLAQIFLGLFILTKLFQQYPNFGHKVFTFLILIFGINFISCGFLLMRKRNEGRLYALSNMFCLCLVSIIGLFYSDSLTKMFFSIWFYMFLCAFFYLIFFSLKDVKENFH